MSEVRISQQWDQCPCIKQSFAPWFFYLQDISGCDDVASCDTNSQGLPTSNSPHPSISSLRPVPSPVGSSGSRSNTPASLPGKSTVKVKISVGLYFIQFRYLDSFKRTKILKTTNSPLHPPKKNFFIGILQ